MKSPSKDHLRRKRISVVKAQSFSVIGKNMASYYDEVEVRSLCSKKKSKLILTKQIEDMDFDEENLLFHSPCPCGDRFEISLVSSNLVTYYLPVTNCDAQTQLQEGEDIARCPSCSLMIRVIYDPVTSSQGKILIGKGDVVEDTKENEKAVNTSLAVEIST
jgi:diphthamide biosynthesis protein 3